MSLPTFLDLLNGGHDVLNSLLLGDYKIGRQMSLPNFLDLLKGGHDVVPRVLLDDYKWPL